MRIVLALGGLLAGGLKMFDGSLSTFMVSIAQTKYHCTQTPKDLLLRRNFLAHILFKLP